MRKLGCIFVLLLFNALLISSAKAGTQPPEKKSHRSELLQKAFGKTAELDSPQSSSGHLLIRVQQVPTSYNSVTKSLIAGIINWLSERPQKELANKSVFDDCSLPSQQHLLFIFPFHNFW